MRNVDYKGLVGQRAICTKAYIDTFPSLMTKHVISLSFSLR